MKRTTQILLFLAIFSLILSACGGSASEKDGTLNADRLVSFNEEGIAVVQGRVAGGWWKPAASGAINETIIIDIPVNVDGIDAAVAVPFVLRTDTDILSTLSPKQTTALAYITFNPNSGAINAFPAMALVEVTFKKQGDTFQTLSIYQVAEKFAPFQRTPSLKDIVVTDAFTKGTIAGEITQAYQQGDEYLWRLSVPILMQGVGSGVILMLESAYDTEIITSDGILLPENVNLIGPVSIEFTRRGDRLIAREITELK